MKTVSKAATHVGMVRELNEDSFLDKGEEGVWVVADGMGGHDRGEVASGAVVAALGAMKPAESFDASVERLRQHILDVNDQLVSSSEDYSRERQPGSTIVALLIQDDHGAVLWAGDSRVYRRRAGAFEQLTQDHTYVNELLEDQLIRPEEARGHRMANVITRAVGIETPLELAVRKIRVLDGDQYLLCSDGLSHLCNDQEINEMMDNRDEDEITDSLIHTALVRGAPDNVTLIYVRCGDAQDGSTVLMPAEDPA